MIKSNMIQKCPETNLFKKINKIQIVKESNLQMNLHSFKSEFQIDQDPVKTY